MTHRPPPGPRLALAAILAATLSAFAAHAADAPFLDVAHAFQLRVAPEGGSSVGIELTAAPGYHLYRDRITVGAPVGSATRRRTPARRRAPTA